MKLGYTGYLRRLQGYSMAFKDFDTAIEVNEETMNKKEGIAIPDTYVVIKNASDGRIDFEVWFFDKLAATYSVSRGEKVTYKNEGNAWGCEANFFIVD